MSRDRRPRPAAPTPGLPASSPVEGSGASSVGLQNGNGVDPARARVSATRERVATPASRAWRCRQPGRAWLAAVDQVYGFRIAIHLLEPPLTEMPGRSQVHEQPAPAAAPNGAMATRHCADLRAKPQGTAEARMDGGHGRKASGASTPWLSQRHASGAPGDRRRQAADISSANGFLGTAGSGPAAHPVQGPGLQGQVTTATPVRSR